MSSVTFTDHNGCIWILRDYRIVAEENQPVPLNDFSAECRAFVSPDSGAVLVYTFGQTSYRTTEPNVLEGQLLFAKPLKTDRLRDSDKPNEQQANA